MDKTPESESMYNRMTDEQFAEIQRVIPRLYEGGDLNNPQVSAWAREWIGPDGGTLALLNELAAERDRLDTIKKLVIEQSERTARDEFDCMPADCRSTAIEILDKIADVIGTIRPSATVDEMYEALETED